MGEAGQEVVSERGRRLLVQIWREQGRRLLREKITQGEDYACRGNVRGTWRWPSCCIL